MLIGVKHLKKLDNHTFIYKKGPKKVILNYITLQLFIKTLNYNCYLNYITLQLFIKTLNYNCYLNYITIQLFIKKLNYNCYLII